MLVQIQGSVIDTEKICKIDQVYHGADYCLFAIYFVDGKMFTISKRVKDIPVEETMRKLREVRNQLIGYWNKSKSPIPEIKID